MSLDPSNLPSNKDLIENIEKATLRLVVQAVYDFHETASDIFVGEKDLVTISKPLGIITSFLRRQEPRNSQQANVPPLWVRPKSSPRNPLFRPF